VEPEEALGALGFTETEARIYCELLRRSPATGYRLAQAVGKAPANTYQALAALTQKGAVLVDDGEAKTYRAVPPAELLGALQQGFERRRDAAETALEKLYEPAGDDRIYQLKTPGQIYERARAMLERAHQIVLFDLFPAPLETLAPDLERAAARGVCVAGLVYGPTPALPFATASVHQAGFLSERWPGAQLGLVVDAREHLTALLTADGRSVKHGVWSDSVYLACLKHSGLAAEIRISALTLEADDPLAFLSLLRAGPPGLRALTGSQPSGQNELAPQGDAA
jgi:sugar-specific transcriptional regulator TrmB